MVEETRVEENKGAEIVEIDPKKVIDVASFGGDVEVGEVPSESKPVEAVNVPAPPPAPEQPPQGNSSIPAKIEKEDMDKIEAIKKNSEQIHIAIGALEIQKMQMSSQVLSLRAETENVAKEALLRAGVPEAKMEEYRVDIKNGAIVPVKDIPQMQRRG